MKLTAKVESDGIGTKRKARRSLVELLRRVAAEIEASRESLEDARLLLAAEFPGWMIYRGGSHLALHVRSGSPRVLLVTEPAERAAVGEVAP